VSEVKRESALRSFVAHIKNTAPGAPKGQTTAPVLDKGRDIRHEIENADKGAESAKEGGQVADFKHKSRIVWQRWPAPTKKPWLTMVRMRNSYGTCSVA
jgi:hypothetical protein